LFYKTLIRRFRHRKKLIHIKKRKQEIIQRETFKFFWRIFVVIFLFVDASIFYDFSEVGKKLKTVVTFKRFDKSGQEIDV